jgi:hypothetical protein
MNRNVKERVRLALHENGSVNCLRAKFLSLIVTDCLPSGPPSLRPFRSIPTSSPYALAHQIAFQYLTRHHMKHTATSATAESDGALTGRLDSPPSDLDLHPDQIWLKEILEDWDPSQRSDNFQNLKEQLRERLDSIIGEPPANSAIQKLPPKPSATQKPPSKSSSSDPQKLPPKPSAIQKVPPKPTPSQKVPPKPSPASLKPQKKTRGSDDFSSEDNFDEHSEKHRPSLSLKTPHTFPEEETESNVEIGLLSDNDEPQPSPNVPPSSKSGIKQNPADIEMRDVTDSSTPAQQKSNAGNITIKSTTSNLDMGSLSDFDDPKPSAKGGTVPVKIGVKSSTSDMQMIPLSDSDNPGTPKGKNQRRKQSSDFDEPERSPRSAMAMKRKPTGNSTKIGGQMPLSDSDEPIQPKMSAVSGKDTTETIIDVDLESGSDFDDPKPSVKVAESGVKPAAGRGEKKRSLFDMDSDPIDDSIKPVIGKKSEAPAKIGGKPNASEKTMLPLSDSDEPPQVRKVSGSPQPIDSGMDSEPIDFGSIDSDLGLSDPPKDSGKVVVDAQKSKMGAAPQASIPIKETNPRQSDDGDVEILDDWSD